MKHRSHRRTHVAEGHRVRARRRRKVAAAHALTIAARVCIVSTRTHTYTHTHTRARARTHTYTHQHTPLGGEQLSSAAQPGVPLHTPLPSPVYCMNRVQTQAQRANMMWLHANTHEQAQCHATALSVTLVIARAAVVVIAHRAHVWQQTA
jgi:hypothetical protein